MDCACQSLREFQNTLELLQIDHLAVFATASLRNISNTSQAVEQIYRATGIAVEILTGEDEAECGFYGAACDTKIENGLFADVGGASAELTLFEGRKPQTAVSVPVGSLKLYRDCVKKILPGKESRRRVADAIEAAFDSDALTDIPRREHLICVGGHGPGLPAAVPKAVWPVGGLSHLHPGAVGRACRTAIQKRQGSRRPDPAL